MNGDNLTYFDRFGVEHITKEIKKIISNKNLFYKYKFIFCFRIWKHEQNNIKIISIDPKKVKMIKICCIDCDKYIKCEKLKVSNI